MITDYSRDARRLHFAPDLEPLFQADHTEKSMFQVRVGRILSLAVFASFGLIDRMIAPDNFMHVERFRYGVICPVLALFFGLSFTPFYKRHAQAIFSVQAIFEGFGLLTLMSMVQPQEPGYALYYSGLMLIIIGNCTVGRLRLISAAVISTVILAGYEYLAVAVHGMLRSADTLMLLVNNSLFLVSAVAIGLPASYLTEVSSRRDFAQRRVIEAERRDAQEAREKAEELLLNILPATIAEQLKQSGAESKSIASAYESVTVLFADIVGFTTMAATMPPNDVVTMLNRVFSTFDRLSDKHGVEKIKTIGDAYMVVSGLPEPRPDHARVMAEMALDMGEAVAHMACETGKPLKLRIGVNSGPVVAGVIGLRKFIYDLWGDTVNTASRMESQGVPGGIQVTEETYRLLRDEYVFSERGEIQVKGKGVMRVYLLTGRIADSEAAPSLSPDNQPATL
jgi:class 3 adenylate cyclase/FtsH-binding integral membrane protein